MNDRPARELLIQLECISAQARNGLACSDSALDIRQYQEILATLKRITRLLPTEGVAESVLAEWTDHPVELSGHAYVTPKIAVAVVVFNEAEDVLLVRRTEDMWTLPGGYADVGLDPGQNASKEVREETGLEVEVVSLVGVYDSNVTRFPTMGNQVYTLAFYGRSCGGELKPDPLETKGAAYHSLDALPQVAPGTLDQIHRALQVSRGVLLPTFFDHQAQNPSAR